MADLRDIDIAALEAITAPYRNALYHRSVFVEGIRRMAFRNMARLIRAMEECGYVDGQRGVSDDWITEVQDKMLTDQGVERTEVNRTLLEWVTSLPLQVYLCLLYASVEFYKPVERRFPLYHDNGMSRYIDEQGALIKALKSFRHSFLHPTEKSVSHEQEFLSIDQSYLTAPALQQEFDQCLARTQEKVWRQVQNELARLPEIQRLYGLFQFFSLYYKARMEEYRDPAGMKHCATQMERFTERIRQLQAELHAWTPDEQQKAIARRIARCLDAVSPSGPEQVYSAICGRTPDARCRFSQRCQGGWRLPRGRGASVHGSGTTPILLLLGRPLDG